MLVAAAQMNHRHWPTRAAAYLFLPAYLIVSAMLTPVTAAPYQQPDYNLVPRADTSVDVRSLLMLAEQGDSRASFLLGSRYASGRGGIRDDSEAVRWFRKAAEKGLAEAQYNLGIMYASGRGVARDMTAAAHWYQHAAAQGITAAQCNLGTLYGIGDGVARDERMAADWLRRAAEKGLPQAQYNLAVLHEHGRGVRMNASEAKRWYQRAAEQGFLAARRRLAVLREKLAAPGETPVVESAPPPSRVPAQATVESSTPTVPGPVPATDVQTTPAIDASSTMAVSASVSATDTQTAPVATVDEHVSTGDIIPAATVDEEIGFAVEASREGLVPVAPAAGAANAGGVAWLNGLDPAHFTLQIASHSSAERAEAFIQRYALEEKAKYVPILKGGKIWFSVMYGAFVTREATTKAMGELPPSVVRSKPWVRRVSAVLASVYSGS
ncbi:MAG: hypothetical protein DRQ37_01170 [Gammaproteobacteria bacterium]|nr:MAG: hypothetical protein DRQ37_01170 [Gammaproteobacteria bacterium]